MVKAMISRFAPQYQEDLRDALDRARSTPEASLAAYLPCYVRHDDDAVPLAERLLGALDANARELWSFYNRAKAAPSYMPSVKALRAEYEAARKALDRRSPVGTGGYFPCNDPAQYFAAFATAALAFRKWALAKEMAKPRRRRRRPVYRSTGELIEIDGALVPVLERLQ